MSVLGLVIGLVWAIGSTAAGLVHAYLRKTRPAYIHSLLLALIGAPGFLVSLRIAQNPVEIAVETSIGVLVVVAIGVVMLGVGDLPARGKTPWALGTSGLVPLKTQFSRRRSDFRHGLLRESSLTENLMHDLACVREGLDEGLSPSQIATRFEIPVKRVRIVIRLVERTYASLDPHRVS